MIYFSKELVASLILGEAVTNSSEGNWIFSKDELADMYGITSPSELKEVVETINNLYPEALLDDPFDYSDPGELNVNLAGGWTLSYWEGRDDMPDSMRESLFTLRNLYDNYRLSRYYTGLFEHWSAMVEQRAA